MKKVNEECDKLKMRKNQNPSYMAGWNDALSAVKKAFGYVPEESNIEPSEEAEDLSIVDEKTLVRNAIGLMNRLCGDFEEYLDFMDIHPEDDEERFAVTYYKTTIVRDLLLQGTSHSGGTSTRKKCCELGFDTDESIIFSDKREEEDDGADV